MKKLMLSIFALSVATLSANAKKVFDGFFDTDDAKEISLDLPLELSGTIKDTDLQPENSSDDRRYVFYRLTCKGGEKFAVINDKDIYFECFHISSNGEEDGDMTPTSSIFPHVITNRKLNFTTNKGDEIYFCVYDEIGKEYSIKFDRGIVKSDIKDVEVGKWVTLTPKVADGYEVESVLVSYDGDDICVNGNQKFIKPAGDVEISVTYKKIDGNDDEEKPNPDNGNEGETGGNQNPTDVEDVNVSAQSIVGEKFHTVLGQPLSEPQTSGVTVVTRTYSDGSTSSSKEVR